jgi:hypothetical protein
MNYTQLLATAFGLLPGFIQSVETIQGSGTGDQKRAAVLQMVTSTLTAIDATSSTDIVDPVAFNEGIGKAVDGLVEAFNASIWAKKV